MILDFSEWHEIGTVTRFNEFSTTKRAEAKRRERKEFCVPLERGRGVKWAHSDSDPSRRPQLANNAGAKKVSKN